MQFLQLSKKNIFDVCRMENSVFLIDETNKLVNHHKYNLETDKVEECTKDNVLRIGTKYESGEDGCVSTAEDYIKFLEVIRT